MSLNPIPHFSPIFFWKDVKITERTAQEISLDVPLNPLVIYLWPHLLAFSMCGFFFFFCGGSGEDGGSFNFSGLNSLKIICKHKDHHLKGL